MKANLMYHSTRNNDVEVTASQAILQGLAPDGGLFVPDRIPALTMPDGSTGTPKEVFAALAAMASRPAAAADPAAEASLTAAEENQEAIDGDDCVPYREVAHLVMREFLTDFTDEELRACIAGAYDDKFDLPGVTRLTEADGADYLELYHGATIAFKDMALSILPRFMTTAAKKNGVKNDIVILTATSGDTGKAALAGFADVPGTKIIVFYPKHGVSPVQEKQMVTQRGANTHVIGIEGNFDDAQTGVKNMFNDKALAARLDAAGYQFSSANSINIGRLVPQVVYYVWSYAQMVASGRLANGDPMNVVVPTGNFGNILAAYYAKRMGTPIAKLICASNVNKVLFDFFESGTYDRNRPFVVTSSPSMDILISSNLERLIWQIAGCDAGANKAFMQELKTTGRYTITDSMRAGLADFIGGYADEAETAAAIHDLYGKCGYIIDTHTAVASSVYSAYRAKTGDHTPTVIASTASPFKFARSVMTAIDPAYGSQADFALIDELSRLANVPVPQAIEDIRSAEIRHKTVCETADMQKEVEKWLGM